SPESTTRNSKQAMQVIELDPKPEVLLDDVLNRDWRLQLQFFGIRILRKQGFGVAFDTLIGDVRHSKSHLGRSSSASSNASTPLPEHYFSFAFCALRARRARSSAVKFFAARKKSAIWRGCWRMMSVRSEATRPARASNSSVSRSIISAIFLTLSSAGGSKS